MTRLLVLFGFVTGGLALAGPALAEPVGVPLKDAVPHMTTTGEASVDVAPDEAELRLAVSDEKSSADEAAASAAKTATSIIDTIKARGIAPADIRTRFYLTETFVDTRNEHGVVTSHVHRGYSATEHVVVTLRDLAKVGPLARELIDKGANSFEGVTFRYSKETQKRRDLDSEAMRDAFQRARTRVDVLGLKLGRVLQIGEDPSEPQASVLADMPTRRAPPPLGGSTGLVIPTEPGVLTLQQSVAVMWEIEGSAR